MPPTTIRSAPALDSFTSLEDHQSQTPASFYGAKPVLYHYIIGANIVIPRDQITKLPVFNSLERVVNEGTEGQELSPSSEDVVLDVFVSSESFTLFNTSTETGVSIPYPAIALHAIQRLPEPESSNPALYGLLMNIELENPPSEEDEEEELDIVELTIVPTSQDHSAEAVQALFTAVSTCSNLHPDPTFQGDEEMGEDGSDRIMFEGSVGYEGISGLPGVAVGTSDGGLPPPFPGSGGWITAENVGEFFDAEGNWLGSGDGEEGQELGEGAGRVRARDEVEDAAPGVNGHREDGDEDQKRQRTD